MRTVRSRKSQSPWPSLAAGGSHKAAPSSISGARTPPQKPQSSVRTQSTAHHPLQQGRAPRKNAALCRLQPPSGAAAVQRGEKRIQGGSRGNSQSPWPSLAAGGSHKAAPSSISGARTPPQKPRSSERTQSTAKPLCPNASAPHKTAPQNQQSRARTQLITIKPTPPRQTASVFRGGVA